MKAVAKTQMDYSRFVSFRFIFFSLLMMDLSVSSIAVVSNTGFNHPYPKAISDLKDVIVKAMGGLLADDFNISGFDLRDTLVGHSTVYEFDVEIDEKVVPFKLLEDIHRWEFVDLPIFRPEEAVKGDADGKGLAKGNNVDNEMPVLAPFQLEGPMELWIQDAKDMRLSLPHEVDAGVLKKVVLADGAVVTVKGARSVSLCHPVNLQLPVNLTNNGFAAGLLTLAERLRHSARANEGSHPISLRIVGPTSLESPSSPSNRLRLKRLAPGLVELSSTSKTKLPSDALDLDLESTTLLAPDRFSTMWPLSSVNGSNANLLGFQALLSSVLGPRASGEGSFRLRKADVSAQTFMKIGFGVEKKLRGDEPEYAALPEWRTKPDKVRMRFEVLARVDGDKVVAERVVQLNNVVVEDTFARNLLTGNVSASRAPPVVHQAPPNPFTL